VSHVRKSVILIEIRIIPFEPGAVRLTFRLSKKRVYIVVKNLDTARTEKMPIWIPQTEASLFDRLKRKKSTRGEKKKMIINKYIFLFLFCVQKMNLCDIFETGLIYCFPCIQTSFVVIEV
jgi:hypothetical protein